MLNKDKRNLELVFKSLHTMHEERTGTTRASGKGQSSTSLDSTTSAQLTTISVPRILLESLKNLLIRCITIQIGLRLSFLIVDVFLVSYRFVQAHKVIRMRDRIIHLLEEL